MYINRTITYDQSADQKRLPMFILEGNSNSLGVVGLESTKFGRTLTWRYHVAVLLLERVGCQTLHVEIQQDEARIFSRAVEGHQMNNRVPCNHGPGVGDVGTGC